VEECHQYNVPFFQEGHHNVYVRHLHGSSQHVVEVYDLSLDGDCENDVGFVDYQHIDLV